MGFNSAFKGLKLLKTPGNGRLNNLNDPVLNVLIHFSDYIIDQHNGDDSSQSYETSNSTDRTRTDIFRE